MPKAKRGKKRTVKATARVVKAKRGKKRGRRKADA